MFSLIYMGVCFLGGPSLCFVCFVSLKKRLTHVVWQSRIHMCKGLLGRFDICQDSWLYVRAGTLRQALKDWTWGNLGLHLPLAYLSGKRRSQTFRLVYQIGRKGYVAINPYTIGDGLQTGLWPLGWKRGSPCKSLCCP